jgi:hypothetical protein
MKTDARNLNVIFFGGTLFFRRAVSCFPEQGHPNIDAITMPYFGIDHESQPGILAVSAGQSIICIGGRTVYWAKDGKITVLDTKMLFC